MKWPKLFASKKTPPVFLNRKVHFVKKTRLTQPGILVANHHTCMPTFNSSCIDSADYDPTSRTLELTFVSGRTYTLTGVPLQLYLGLLNATSPGWYFNAYLKGRY